MNDIENKVINAQGVTIEAMQGAIDAQKAGIAVQTEVLTAVLKQLAHNRKYGCYPERSGGTHYDGCWKAYKHHECAIRKVEELEATLEAASQQLVSQENSQ